ncbi:hypothetical protein EW145_g406 [Phellinidium pouzarii]|uniref:DNA repair protein RAD14 n=1 Tax=Phellinidium pouzarii TaxID=167371 RepID=A0A4S4LK98_9AGAM|nr:hypothetical protein EW145_g406 [Phellinidium pouzarii]
MSSSSRPVTPPPRQNIQSSNVELTPEQVKRIELNRLRGTISSDYKTKGPRECSIRIRIRIQHPQRKQQTSTRGDARNVDLADRVKPAQANARPIPRSSRLGKYFEYDLSKMVNSKGGFLVEDEKEATDDLRARERERERERAMQNIEPPISLDPDQNPKCIECGTVDIDHTVHKVFRCRVCNKCKDEKPEKYSLLTKTECKEDYLLTDPELRDSDLMPHLLKANPHASTFSNMMLFLRYQVEEFAWKKWGSPEALDAEFERRAAEKKKKKSKKFEEGLNELRRRTRESSFVRRQDEEHKHKYGVVEKGDNGMGLQICHECGFIIEVEEF